MSKRFILDVPEYRSTGGIAEELIRKINESISCCLNDLTSKCIKEKLTPEQYAKIYAKVMDGVRNIADSRLKNSFSVENGYREEIEKASARHLCTDESSPNSF